MKAEMIALTDFGLQSETLRKERYSWKKAQAKDIVLSCLVLYQDNCNIISMLHQQHSIERYYK